jgi:hypothetical protein
MPLEKMSADMRAVETGELEKRLRELALTGRVSEQEYRALLERSSRAAVVANGRTSVVPIPSPAPADRP